MPLPQPAVPLQNPCTTIFDGKLYSYQPDAFQVLELKEGGKWTNLTIGVPVTGSACVQGTFDKKPAFILVGGSTSTKDYHGIQHYDLTSNQWQMDKPADDVAVNRLHHGAAFLPQSSTILMYAGSQDNLLMASTQTFLIHTESPYAVEAFESSAPPVTDPLMLTYNASHALMLGGSSTNTNLSTFSPQTGWKYSSTHLQSPLPEASKVQAAIYNSGNSSKTLELFDLSQSPNRLGTLSLQNSTGSLMARSVSTPHELDAHHAARRQKRDERPVYNASSAPSESRSGFSLASDLNSGLVIAVGGSSQSPLAIFNQTSNQWVDSSAFFGSQSSPSSTPTSSPITSTPTASPTSFSPVQTSATPAATSHAHNRSMKIIGGVLGGVLGAALLLVILLLLLRCSQKRKQQRTQQPPEYAMDTKPNPMDFTDVGATFMKSPADSGAVTPETTHQRNRSERSIRSVDPKSIDRNLTASSESRRALLHSKGDSAGSGASFWGRGMRPPAPVTSPPQISAPVMGPSLSRSLMIPESPSPGRAETGWSQYFNDGSKDMLGNLRPPQSRPLAGNRPNTDLSSSQTQSDYMSSRIPSSHHHESAEVEPLGLRASQAPPTTAGITSPYASRPGLGLAITQGPSPDRDRSNEPGTPSTPVSDYSDTDELHHLSHGSDGHDSWTPVATSGERNSNWTDERPDSSVTNSRLYAHPGERVEIPIFPMPNSASNSAAASPQVRSPALEQSGTFQNWPTQRQPPASDANHGLRNVITPDLIRTRSGRMQPVGGVQTGVQRVGAGSSSSDQPPSYRTFPRPREPQVSHNRASSQTEDMSWLNLGTSAEQHRNMYFPER